MKIKMIKSPDRWVLCPICGNKTRTKIRPDTILENFPLFCPKCKQETLISAKDLNVAVIPQQIAESAGAVNGQDERRKCATVDSRRPSCFCGNQGSDRLKCCRSRPLWGKDSRKFHIYVL